MDDKVNAWLEDILRSIDEIFRILPEKSISDLTGFTQLSESKL